MKMRSRLFLLSFVVTVGLLGGWGCWRLIAVCCGAANYYNEWPLETERWLERKIAMSFPLKMSFVSFNGLCRKLMGQRKMNGVVKADDGALVMPFSPMSDVALSEYSDSIAVLSSYLKRRGVPLVYVNCFCKPDPQNSGLPWGERDGLNPSVDAFLAKLTERSVDVMDLRALAHADGYSVSQLMYRTDHHWTTEGGFYAASKIIARVCEILGCEVDSSVCNIGCYKLTVYPQAHLGSYGRRVGPYFAGIDNYTLIEPRFETQLQRDGVSGSFSDLVLDRTALAQLDFWNRDTYDDTTGRALGNFINLRSRNNVKLLVIADSFARAVNPYLILGFREVQYLYNKLSNSLSKEYIEQYKPDMVILLYYPGQLYEGPSAFDFKAFAQKKSD